MPYYIVKILFPVASKYQLFATENSSIILKTYNRTAFLQLGICSVTVNHNTVPGYGPALIGMSDTETLDILIIATQKTFKHHVNKLAKSRQMSRTVQTGSYPRG